MVPIFHSGHFAVSTIFFKFSEQKTSIQQSIDQNYLGEDSVGYSWVPTEGKEKLIAMPLNLLYGSSVLHIVAKTFGNYAHESEGVIC